MTKNHGTREALAAECLERVAAEGPAALDELCDRYPQHAAMLRGVVQELCAVGLFEVAEHAGTPGRVVGEYRLLRPLGRGGMGEVWLARHTALDRVAALKLLSTGRSTSPRARERFRREADALARLDHPNICKVFDSGEDKGALWLAMRYVEGETLARRIERWRAEVTVRTPPATRIAVTVAVAERIALALHAAHEHSIVHRDVKPHNIMLAPDGRPVLLDFGLARADTSDPSDLTLSGEPLGTPAYMAPEQLQSSRSVDHRVDIHALGVVLYEAATLRRPFSAVSRAELWDRILREEPRNPREHDPSISRDLAAVITKALEKDPERRFQTAAELAAELGRIRDGEPTLTRPPGPVRRSARWTRRNRTAATALLVVTVALAVAGWLLDQRTRDEARARAVALAMAADSALPESPELAFKLMRECVRLAGISDPDIFARAQAAMLSLPSTRVLDRLGQGLEQAVVSPDERWIAVGGRGVGPWLYTVEGEPVGSLPLAGVPSMPGLAFAPEGTELAIGMQDGSVRRIRLETGRWIAAPTLPAPAAHSPVVAVNYREPSGGSVLVTREDGSGALFRRDGVLQCEVRSNVVGAGAFLPDGGFVVGDAMFDARGNRGAELDHPSWRTVECVRATADRILIVSSDAASLLRHDGSLVDRFVPSDPGDPRTRFDTGEFSPDGLMAALGALDGQLTLLDAASGEVRSRGITSSRRSIVSLCWSPDGRRIYTGDHGGTITEWDEHLRQTQRLHGHESAARWIGPLAGGSRILSVSWDGMIRIWSLATPHRGGRVVRGLDWPDVAVTEDGSRILIVDSHACTLYDDQLEPLWQRRWSEPGVNRVSFQRDGLTALAFTSRGRLLAFATGDPTRIVTDHVYALVEEGGMMSAVAPWVRGFAVAVDFGLWLHGPDGRASRVPLTDAAYCFPSSDPDRILFARSDGSVAECHPASGDVAELFRLPACAFDVRERDRGRRMLAGSADGNAYLWNAEKSEFELILRGHRSSVVSVAVSPDGKTIATGSNDRTARLWDRVTGQSLLELRHEGNVTRVLFSHDGRYLITASTDGAVRWWWLDRREFRAAMDAADVPELTEDERSRLAHPLR